MPASPPYIPPRDTDFDLWLENLETLITANPTNYGLVAGDATIIAAQNTAWHAAFILATTPATRTSANIAAKDAARASAEAVVRPYCQRIRANDSVSDALKVGLGLNLQPATLTPIPPPASTVALAFVAATPLATKISYADTVLPSGKAKPYGAVGVEIYVTLGTAPASDPNAADYVKTVTKSPNGLTWVAGDVGKVATVWARYTTASGPAGEAQKGPWSAPLSFTVM